MTYIGIIIILILLKLLRMGKCVGKYRRVEHYDPKLYGTEVYDKFGNLIAGGSNRVEVQYNGRRLLLTKSI